MHSTKLYQSYSSEEEVRKVILLKADSTEVVRIPVSYLVGTLRPVNHKELHRSWTQTSLYLQVIYFTSHHTTSHAFLAFLYSAGTQHGNLHPIGWPILFCGPTQELLLATANTRKKNQERFGKNAGKWTGSVELSTKEIPDSKRITYGYILTYSRL